MLALLAVWYVVIGFLFTSEILPVLGQWRRASVAGRITQFLIGWALWPINFYRMEKWSRSQRR